MVTTADRNLAELVLGAHDLVRFLRRFTSAPGSGATLRDEAAHLVTRLGDLHRVAAGLGVPLAEALHVSTIAEIPVRAGLHLGGEGAGGGLSDDEKREVYTFATAPRLAEDLIPALPRITVATAAVLADVPVESREPWLEHVKAAAEQSGTAALATLTLPGRAVTAVTASRGEHPERKVLDELGGGHLAELMGASTLAVVGTTPLCPLCCIELARVLVAHPLLTASVRVWGGPVVAVPDDDVQAAAAPVVIVVTTDVAGTTQHRVSVPAAAEPGPLTAPAPTPESAPAPALSVVGAESEGGAASYADQLVAALARGGVTAVPDAPVAVLPMVAAEPLPEPVPVSVGSSVSGADEHGSALEAVFSELAVVDAGSEGGAASYADQLVAALARGGVTGAPGRPVAVLPMVAAEPLPVPELAVVDAGSEGGAATYADQLVAALASVGVTAVPDAPVAVLPMVLPQPVALPRFAVATTPDADDRDVALLIESVHAVVRFLPTFTSAADLAQANDHNMELQRLAAVVGERHLRVAASGVRVAELPDSELDRLPVAFGMDMAGTLDDGSLAEWEAALTRQLLCDVRLAAAARTDPMVVLPGAALCAALTRLIVSEPLALDTAASSTTVAREWQRLSQPGEGQSAAVAMVTVASEDALTVMTTSDELALVHAYVAGVEVPGRGRLPRYQPLPPPAPDGGDRPRHLHPEKKLFDYLATNHHPDLEQGEPTVTIACTDPMCPSCCYVALQFLVDFPNVRRVVVRLAGADAGTRGLRRLLPVRS